MMLFFIFGVIGTTLFPTVRYGNAVRESRRAPAPLSAVSLRGFVRESWRESRRAPQLLMRGPKKLWKFVHGSLRDSRRNC